MLGKQVFILCAPVLSFAACGSPSPDRQVSYAEPRVASMLLADSLTDDFEVFDRSNHLRPYLKRESFDTLHCWDLGWAVLEEISIAQNDEHEVQLAKCFSPGQKALYFYWYLDAQVTNGGFMQFFLNGYQRYVPTIDAGLRLIGDTATAGLLAQAHADCLAHREEFELVAEGKNDWSWLRERLPRMDKMDEEYFRLHDSTMTRFESFIREHPSEFVILR